MNLVEYLFGPLAGVECRRALGKPRWVWLRLLTGLPGLALVLIFIWIWWVFSLFGWRFSAALLLRWGVVTIDSLAVAIAMILSPAVLAATLAGEKDRGTLTLLLTSRVSAREIILAKLTSRLLPVLMMLMAGLPALALMAGLPELGFVPTLLLWLLPLAVALGGAGLALAVSAVARKGRDALLTVYILEIAIVLVPLFLIDILPPSMARWLLAFNPFHGIFLLAMRGAAERAAVSIGVWAGVGLLGIAWATWRLVPIYLRQLDGGPRRGKAKQRRTATIGDRPMLWKEMHSEQGTRSRPLRWLGWLLMGTLSVTALALGGVVLVEQYGVRLGWVSADANGNANLHPQVLAMAELLRGWATISAYPLSWLVQWAVGMRAAVTIAAEREQHTWDTLMTTPLEGHEIVGPKIVGSLWSMKFLLAVAVIAWAMAAVSGAIEPVNVWNLVSRTIVASAFMAAVGAWASAQAATAARAMTVTLALWLAAAILGVIVAGLLACIATIVLMIAYTIADFNGVYAIRDFIGLLSFSQGYEFIRLALFTGATFAVAYICRRNFDALAGRNYIRTYIPPPPSYVQYSPLATGPLPSGGAPYVFVAHNGAPPAQPPRPRPTAEIALEGNLPPIPGGAQPSDRGPSAAPSGMPALPVVNSTTPPLPDDEGG